MNEWISSNVGSLINDDIMMISSVGTMQDQPSGSNKANDMIPTLQKEMLIR
jgi:hypothetical protein